MAIPNSQSVMLLGEGTFHQLHGGIATNSTPTEISERFQAWDAQYKEIRGHFFIWPSRTTPSMYVGTLPASMLTHFVYSAISPQSGPAASPLGRNFDFSLWRTETTPIPPDPTIAAVIDLAQREFRKRKLAAAGSICRITRELAPDEPEPQRLLKLVATAIAINAHNPQDAEYFLAMGDAYRLLGQQALAAEHYNKALMLDSNLAAAHTGLATLRLPGEFYLQLLERLYSTLSPKFVLEVGIFDGSSLSKVPASAIAIGVDPNPSGLPPFKAETHIFTETSNEFFARRGPKNILGWKCVNVALIKGTSLYEQALRDFINLEKYCNRKSVILIHNTYPLDDPTQSRERNTFLHTGDVWKIILCLKHYRPDLDIFTVAAPWTGLTVISNLNPHSRTLKRKYNDAILMFQNTSFSSIANRIEDALNVVRNDWSVVEARLKANRIL